MNLVTSQWSMEDTTSKCSTRLPIIDNSTYIHTLAMFSTFVSVD